MIPWENYIYIYSLFPHSLFVTCLDSGLATSSCPNLKYAYVYSLVFFVLSTLQDLRCAPEAHVVAFQTSRLDQDHFPSTNSVSWPGLGFMPGEEYHTLVLF